MKKRILSFVLVIIMAIGLMPTVVFAETVTSGNCGINGDNVTWSLNGTELTISGVGEMKNFPWDNNVPWFNGWYSNLTSVIIENGVTSIGNAAFNNKCYVLESITIPNSVISIGDSAFSGCYSLTSISIPDSVTSIGSGAFFGCDSLTSISIPDSVTSIGSGAFNGCSNLSYFSIGSGLKSIGEGAFYSAYDITKINISDIATLCEINYEGTGSCPSYGADLYLNNELVENLVIPEGVSSINDSAFYGFQSITSVTIPGSVESIGFDTFGQCSNLVSVNIENGLKSIKKSAFRQCSSLTSITIPKSVVEINEGAFENCTSLSDVYFDGTKEEFEKIKIYDDNTRLTSATIHFKEASTPTPTPTPQPQPTPVEKPIYNTSQIFTDVAKDWYTQYVDYAYSYGIFKGNENGTFKPLANITRAEFVQVLANITGVDTSNKAVVTKFSDVRAGDWFAPAVKWANDNRIVAGKYANQFAPEENITREQMCVMIVNYAKFKGITLKVVEAKEAFVDDSLISSWAKDAVYACQMADIVNGKGEGRFDPAGTGLRAEACVIFTKFHQNYLK